MADTSRTENSTTRQQGTQPGQQHGQHQGQQSGQRDELSRRDPREFGFTSPFTSLFRRWNDEMDRMFDDVGFGPGRQRAQGSSAWSPQVEVQHRGNDLVIRADLPGMNREDISVDVADDVLTISGERRNEHQEEHEGWYRTERHYGQFCRTVPLPEGAIPESAKATFKDGVLEIEMQAPSNEVNQGRRLEIK